MSEIQNYLDKALSEVDFDETQKEVPIPFPESLIAARESQGMTQEALSQKTGIPQSSISLIENGKANPSVRVLKKIAEGLGMKLVIEFTK